MVLLKVHWQILMASFHFMNNSNATFQLIPTNSRSQGMTNVFPLNRKLQLFMAAKSCSRNAEYSRYNTVFHTLKNIYQICILSHLSSCSIMVTVLCERMTNQNHMGSLMDWVNSREKEKNQLWSRELFSRY